MTDKHSAGEQTKQSSPTFYTAVAMEKGVAIAEESGYQRAMAAVERHVLGTESLPDGFHTAEVIARVLTAATADAKLAGELAGREAALGLTRYWTTFSDGFHGLDPAPIQSNGDWVKYADIENLPLTPDSAEVLERIKRAERARGARDAFLLAGSR